MTSRVIDVMAAPDSFLAGLLLMDGMPAYVQQGGIWTDALHQHRADAPSMVEIRAPWDVDRLIEDARRCHIDECPGRETVARIDAARHAEYGVMRERMGATS